MRRIAALSFTAVLLAACGSEAPGGGAAPPPADAPAPAPPEPTPDPAAAFRVDFAARGNEPFWRADVKGGEVRVTRPDAPDLVATNAGLAATAGAATWTAQAGQIAVVLTVTRAACSDGMSDLKYDYAAELKLGAETFKGCGFPLSAEPREGQ